MLTNHIAKHKMKASFLKKEDLGVDAAAVGLGMVLKLLQHCIN
jgi:hypothetical protein